MHCHVCTGDKKKEAGDEPTSSCYLLWINRHPDDYLDMLAITLKLNDIVLF